MRLSGRQSRFVVGAIAAWSGIRAATWWGGAALAALAGLGGTERLPWADPLVPRAFEPVAGSASPSRIAPYSLIPVHLAVGLATPSLPRGLSRRGPGGADPGSLDAAASGASLAPAPAAGDAPSFPDRPAGIATLPNGMAGTSRWSATLYAYGRPGHAGASLADGGQLGGSQLALRLAYRLNRDGPVRTSAALRLYVPLGSKGAEAAAGLDWHPFGGVPARLSVERRFGLDRAGRDAWSAYAAGGFYREPIGGRLVIDGYGQAGLVGLHHRDPFVDGAVRVGGKATLGKGALVAGGGVWGAAQPDLARLDLGPRVGLTLPIGGRAFTVAVEGRFRVAGQARPGSGVALTFGADL